MNPRDSETGAEILAVVRAGNVIQILDDGIPVIHLSPSAALLLARQIDEVTTLRDIVNLAGGAQ